MAIYNNSSQNNRASATTGLPAARPLTVFFRLRKAATKTGFQCYWSRNVGASDADLYIGNASSNVDRMYVYTGGSDVIGTAAAVDAMRVGVPYAITVTHATDDTCHAYIDGKRVISGSGGVAGSGETSIRLLSNELNEECNHEIWDHRIWTAVLTQEEIALETRSDHPVRKANLFCHHTLNDRHDLNDKWGTFHLTEAGTLLTRRSEYPHKPGVRQWALGLLTQAAGGTTYNQSVSGTLTTAGAAAKRANLARGGTLTTAGTLSRRTNAVKAGTLTTAGAIAKQTAKPLAGTLTSSGALVAAKVAVLALAGTLTSAGALARRTGKAFTGTLTTAGTLAKQTSKAFAGTLTSAGTLARVKVAVLALSGTLTTAGAIVRRTNKGLAGTLTTSGALVKVVSRRLAGTLTTAGALAKQVARRFTGTLTSGGTVTPEVFLESPVLPGMARQADGATTMARSGAAGGGMARGTGGGAGRAR